jgi:hypothetical protein
VDKIDTDRRDAAVAAQMEAFELMGRVNDARAEAQRASDLATAWWTSREPRLTRGSFTPDEVVEAIKLFEASAVAWARLDVAWDKFFKQHLDSDTKLNEYFHPIGPPPGKPPG